MLNQSYINFITIIILTFLLLKSKKLFYSYSIFNSHYKDIKTNRVYKIYDLKEGSILTIKELIYISDKCWLHITTKKYNESNIVKIRNIRYNIIARIILMYYIFTYQYS